MANNSSNTSKTKRSSSKIFWNIILKDKLKMKTRILKMSVWKMKKKGRQNKKNLMKRASLNYLNIRHQNHHLSKDRARKLSATNLAMS